VSPADAVKTCAFSFFEFAVKMTLALSESARSSPERMVTSPVAKPLVVTSAGFVSEALSALPQAKVPIEMEIAATTIPIRTCFLSRLLFWAGNLKGTMSEQVG
jgi:hypothetical protein